MSAVSDERLGSRSSNDSWNEWRVDWRRLGRRALIAGMAAVAFVTLYMNATGRQYALDFRGGMWHAGKSLLDGTSPYPAPVVSRLLSPGNAFIPPPLLAVIAIPFSVLPFGFAIMLWNVLCVASCAAALRVLGVRDWRVYVVALCSFPLIASLILGQPDGLFALAAAVAWRYRDSSKGAVAVGALIAAKLLAWPLLVWLLVTRRVRSAAVAAVSAVGFVLGSWACIGFKGLGSYANLLSADAHAFEARSQSVVAAAMRLGLPEATARILAIAFAVAVAAAVIRSARTRDEGWFTATLLLGLLISPILWSHYLVVLLVPLAITRPRLDRLWLLLAVFWLSPLEPPKTVAQIILVLLTAAALGVRSGSKPALEPAASIAAAQPGTT